VYAIAVFPYCVFPVSVTDTLIVVSLVSN